MTAKTYQQTQLRSIPARALLFLRALSTKQQIRSVMGDAGYTDDDQSEGWRLLYATAGRAATKLGVDVDATARQAIAELDAWDEAGCKRIHAALARLHPEQDAAVFDGIEPSHGPGAVLSVAKLLERLDELDKGSEADRAAMATLAKRGIDTRLREHLRNLVAVAQAAKPVDPPEGDADPQSQQALEALAFWYKDWADTARAVVRRRDHLILMGLSRRRTKKDEPDVEVVPTPVSPSTTTTESPTTKAATAANTNANAAE